MLHLLFLLAFILPKSLSSPFPSKTSELQIPAGIEFPKNVGTFNSMPDNVRDVRLRVIDGTKASEYQFPWHVRLIMAGPTGYQLCGGSIISREWILTAAHCFDGAWYAQIQYGAVEVGQMLSQNSSNFYPHPSYNASWLIDDIGLIRLCRPLDFTRSVNSVPLPWKYGSCENYLDRQAFFSGCGHTHDNATDLTQEIKYVRLRVMSNVECLHYYTYLVRPTVVCAVGLTGMSGICIGDSGSGLVLSDQSAWPTLIGVASFTSIETCHGMPGGFTRVVDYKDWIRTMTGGQL